MKPPLPLCEPQELWSHQPLLPHSLVIWDAENISLRYVKQIKHLAKFTPYKRYAISKMPLSEKQERLLTQEGFTLFEHYPFSADAKIVELIRRHQLYTHLMLITSDSDFVPSVKRFLLKRHVQWIMQDENKKRICMYMNLTHPRLTLSTFASKYPITHSKKHSHKHKTPSSLHNEKAWLAFFNKYHSSNN